MAGAAAGGAQRSDGGGGTFNLDVGLPCVPVLPRAACVPDRKFFWNQMTIELEEQSDNAATLAEALFANFYERELIDECHYTYARALGEVSAVL